MLLLCACKGGFGTFLGGDVSEPNYADEADENLKRGSDALDSKNYIEAQKYFDYVKSKYPYLEAATTAELKLGDVDFEREKYLEARDRYQNFIKLHPTHPKIDYAAYRAALTHYKDMPSDFFLLPPSSEKDQAEVRSASVALADFIRSYPQSEYPSGSYYCRYQGCEKRTGVELLSKEAKARTMNWLLDFMIDKNRKRDVTVVWWGKKLQTDADKRIKQWSAELEKAKAELQKAGDKPTDAQRQRVSDAERKLKEAEDAKAGAVGKPEETLQQLVAKYPDSPAAKRAQGLLEKK